MFAEFHASLRGMRWAAFAVAVGMIATAASPSTAQDRGVVARVEVLNEVKGDKPMPARARVSRVGNAGAEGAVGKYLEGTARLLETNDGLSAQIRWQSLRQSPGTGPAAAVPGLGSLVRIGDGTTLKSGAQIPVAGDITALIRAATTLDETARKQAKEPEKDDDEKETADRDSQGQTTGSLGGGSPARQNNLATPPAIQAPDVQKTTTETIATDAFGTTTEGCEPEFDPDKGVMIVMAAPTKNGEKTGACESTLEELPIRTSHVGCGYEVELQEGVAYAKGRRFYTYGPNTTYLDEACKPDTDQAFKIEEVEAECRVQPDLVEMVATQLTKLIFRGRENETIEAAGCAERAGATFKIENRAEECALRDDFAAGRTWVQHRPVYVGDDGLKRVIGECTDTETFYAHIKDTTVCDPIADYTEGELYEQYRIRIAAPVENEFRTGACKPNAEATTNLVETGVGCESFHVDYDGYSLGGTQILRADTGEVVRACEEAEVRYQHQREAQGWQYDDAKLQAFPKEALFIVLPQPAGKTYIEQAVVREDAQPTPYGLTRTYLKTGATEYVDGSCDRYIQQRSMEVYERPDGTEHEVDAGAGPPLGPTNACRVVIEDRWPLVSSGGWYKTGRMISGCGWEWKRSGTYAAVRDIIREDGVTIVEDQTNSGVRYGKNPCGAKACAILAHGRDVRGPSCPGTIAADMSWVQSKGWTQP